MTARQSTKAELIPALIADVFELAGALQASSDALAAVAGQTGARWQVLWVADEAARTVPDIARRLGRTRQAVQRLADVLVDDGLAEWQTNPAHSRSPFLVLTAGGRRALGAIMRGSLAPYLPVLEFILAETLVVVLGFTLTPYLALKRGALGDYVKTMVSVPPLMIYLAFSNGAKILQTMRGRKSTFKRTPKTEHAPAPARIQEAE